MRAEVRLRSTRGLRAGARSLCLWAFLFLVGCTSPETVQPWPETVPVPWIVSPEQARRLMAAGARVLDVRAEPAYLEGHVEGALSTRWEAFSRSDDPYRGRLLEDDALLQSRIRALGIDGEAPVLVVGDPRAGWGEDGRLVWTLRTAGHERAAFVDGGLLALADAGVALSVARTPPPPAGGFTVRRRADWTVETAWVESHLRDPEVVFVDAREAREYAGETPYGESRGGHLPGAVHLYYKDLLDPQGRLRGTAELRSRLEARGIAPEKTVVAYCTGGVRSAWLVAVLVELGFPAARNYAGSMWEWSAQPESTHPLVK